MRNILTDYPTDATMDTLVTLLESYQKRLELNLANPAHLCEALMGYYWSYQDELVAVGSSGDLRTLCFDLGTEAGISMDLLFDMDEQAQNRS